MVGHSRLTQLFVCLLTIQACYTYQYYQLRFPNGDNVPHPCKVNQKWKGVGHTNPLGGGDRNPFGVDFSNNDKIWNATLCILDSDGDGITNGEELGDPYCTWVPGKTTKSAISHPGICEPLGSKRCGAIPDYLINCESEEFTCAVIDEPDTFNRTVRFPANTPVPNVVTTYACMFFEFPSDQEYHMVANIPHIDNVAVMHHIIAYGCTGDISNDVELNTVRHCGMGSGHPSCRDIIAAWSVGVAGSCEHPNTGFLIGGSNGYTYGSFQFHWNNPELSSDYTDSSGITFYLTPKLRAHNAGVFVIGQNYFEIPPGELSIVREGRCSSHCTKKIMRHPINITTVFNHMHYLGDSQLTELRRDGFRVETLANDEVYNYDNPDIHIYGIPIVAKPGDEFKTTCGFGSTSRQYTVYFGDETSDEMCLSFLTYYPKENLRSSFCVNYASIDSCDLPIIQGCNMLKLRNYSNPDVVKLYTNINRKCATNHCRKECKEFIKVLKATDPCFQGDVYKILKRNGFRNPNGQSPEELEYYSRVDSCDLEIALEQFQQDTQRETGGTNDFNASILICVFGLLLNLIP